MPSGTSGTVLCVIVGPPSRAGIRTDLTNYGRAVSYRLTESSRNTSGFPALGILGPLLGQIQAIGNGKAGIPSSHRQTHRYLAVVLLPQLSAVLTCDPTECVPFLGKPVSQRGL